ncbi:hypothetical protein [Thermobifida fusca]|uniref:hypothetical protein n=1 Tax=Thermobifida fusca TaxID=2021 RepID=UPI00156B5432|nr:hypothetical protein [Thermobifida fusca]
MQTSMPSNAPPGSTARIYWTDASTGGTAWWIVVTSGGRVIGRGPLVATGRTESGTPTVTYRCATSGELRTVAYGGGMAGEAGCYPA